MPSAPARVLGTSPLPPAERRRPSRPWRALGPLAVIWTLAVIALYAVAAQDRVPADHLFLDPATLSGRPWYTGLAHETGILGWTVATTAAAFGAWIARLDGRHAAARFLGSGAVLSAVLLLDDATGFHADAGQSLGIPKPLTIAAIVGLAVTWVLRHPAQIVRTRWLTLGAALGALAVSVAADLASRRAVVPVFLEDAPKLLGILGWATYFVMTVADIVTSVARRPGPTVGAG